jgi:adenylate kinase
MKPVIYLTGPPAVGKSTLCERLVARVPDLEVLHYSRLLRDYLAEKDSPATEDGIRMASAAIITPQIVREVDDLLIERVRALRTERPIIIDSHAVTKEQYGYRITPFALAKFRELEPTHVCLLYADSETIMNRISENAQGRPEVSSFEAEFHLYLQSQVAVMYGMELGLQIYALDNARGAELTFERILSWLA